MHSVSAPTRHHCSSVMPLLRRGVSLIELLIVISIMGTVFILSGVTFHLLLRSEKVVAQSFVTERSISRLAVQFREDVHRSKSGTVVASTTGTAFEMILADANRFCARYVITKDGLARLLVEQDLVTAREDFRLPDCRVEFGSGTEADPFVKTLVIARPSAAPSRNSEVPRPFRPLEIQAHLNRFSRAIDGDAVVRGGDVDDSLPKTTEDRP